MRHATRGQSSRSQRIRTALLALAALAVLSGLGLAADSGKEEAGKNAARSEERSDLSHLSAQRVHIDPQTGQIREAEHDEIRQLNEEIKKLFASPLRNAKPVRHPNGMVSLELDASYRSFSLVRIGPDGAVVVDCVENPDGAKRFLEQTAAPQKGGQLDVQ